ncbi:MAG: CsbD family protein [Myxococcaceae bacterium]
MSNQSNRAEGVAEELGGKIKNVVGKVIGNEQMEAEGKLKALKGKGKQELAKGAERAKGKIEEVVGAAKNRIGAVIGNEQMQVEGKVKELKGQARQATNK